MKKIIGMLFILAICSYIAVYVTFLSIPAAASIDDLRIICALLDCYDRWGDKEYFNMAGILQEFT